MSEKESNNVEIYKSQVRKWNALAIKHLPETQCDRDNVKAIDELIKNSIPLSEHEAMTEKQKKSINEALEIASNYAYIDGAHHKNWVINEMVSALLSEEEREAAGWNDPDWLEECIAP